MSASPIQTVIKWAPAIHAKQSKRKDFDPVSTEGAAQ